MTTAYSSPSNQTIAFPSSPYCSPLGFGFASSAMPSSSFNTPTKPQLHKKSSKKREFNDEEDTKMLITDEDTENRPVRTLKKVKSTINTKSDNSNSEEADIGVLLASLPHQSLLSLMNNVINQEPSVKQLIMNKIPQPSLSTYINALNESTAKVINCIPIGQSRSIYTISRLKVPLTDWTKVVSTYLPFFTSSNVHVVDKFMAIQPTTLQFVKVLSQLPPLPSDQVPKSLSLVWDKLRLHWSQWFNQVDDIVNKDGGMFSSSIVHTWAKGLDETCQHSNTSTKPQGFNYSCQMDLLNLRQNWESRLGWLIGKDITPRPEWAQ
ncbi:hypothetical protein E3P99_00928 [Wallemia hederae]|uniref:Tethering factor for nuclear proteasome STS1 n=1 Tax=Wallemia hederae TaxID=1540922 RepID=A0A4V4LTV4_9BASI|nr:hypothetical protein E3P99_00928 [Wallemia hederae]